MISDTELISRLQYLADNLEDDARYILPDNPNKKLRIKVWGVYYKSDAFQLIYVFGRHAMSVADPLVFDGFETKRSMLINLIPLASYFIISYYTIKYIGILCVEMYHEFIDLK